MLVHNPNNLPTIPIADLLPTQGDLKDLTEVNYKKLKNVIERRGFSYPVYVWEDKDEILHLLDGHQRQRVLNREGWNDPIPYLKVPAKDLQEAMARLLEITSQYATITQEGIDEFIGKYELNDAEVYEATRLDALAFDKTEEEPEVEEDEAPEVSSEPPVSKLGEIYQLGRHRVMCGDSTEHKSIAKLLGGQKMDAVFTDPPYGMHLNVDQWNTPAKKGQWVSNKKDYEKVIGDGDDFKNEFIEIIFELFGNCKEIFLWGADYYAQLIPKRNEGSWISWDKRAGGLEDVQWSTSEFELCWSKGKHQRKIARFRWMGVHGMEKQDTDKRVHPTQKPVELCVWFINNWIKDKNIVDLFLGSGSTLIACEQTDRTCYGMELDPKYIDVIRKRYAKFTSPDNELPDNWEELTPAIERELSEANNE